jgi:hypothetical protein
MKYYQIDVSGYGGEVVYGKLTKEQYEFWEDKDESDIINHAFWDPYDEDNEENIVSDENSPHFIGYWHDKEEIVHLNGTTMQNCWITITECGGPEWNDETLEEIVEQVDLDKFIETNRNNVEQEVIDLDDYATDDGHNYIFYGMSIEKGQFHLSVVELPDDEVFDPSKIIFHATELDNGDNIVEVVSYGDYELNNMGGDSTGKGYSTSVYDY